MTTKAKQPKTNRSGSPDQIKILRAISRSLKAQGFSEGNERQFNALIEASNLIVDAFAKPDTPSVPGSGLAAWAASDDTGLSSRAMARRLAPLIGETFLRSEADPWNARFHPLDPADLGRCVRLLDAVPDLRPHLPAMADVSPEWAALVAAWGELEALYREEFPSGRAPKCWDRMKEILDGVPREEP